MTDENGYITDTKLLAHLNGAPTAAPKPHDPMEDSEGYIQNPELLAHLNAPQQSGGTFAKGLARSVAKGVTLNWGDEAEAGLRTGFGYAGDYTATRDKIRLEQDEFARQNPKTALAAELVGSVAVPGVGGAKAIATLAPKASGLVRKVAAGTAVGGTEGAIAGAGAAEDQDMTGSSLVGGGIGAAVGGALPVVGAVARPIAQAVGSRLPSFTGAPAAVADQRATAAVRDAMQRDAEIAGRTLSQETGEAGLNAAMDRARGGNGALLTSAGENVGELAKDVATKSTGARRTVNEFVDEVAQARPGKSAYDTLYAQPQFKSSALESLIADRPAAATAARLAMREVQNTGGAVNDAGKFSPIFTDMLDRSLQQMIKTNASAGRTTTAANISAVRDELRTIIQSELPTLAHMQSQYAAGSSLLRASPKPGHVVAGPDAAADLMAYLHTGASVSHGHVIAAIGRVSALLGGGQKELADATMKLLLTRTRTPAEMNAALAKLENMTPTARERYLRGAIDATKIGVGATGAAAAVERTQ